MDNKKKKEPWRIIVFLISLVFIVFMWAKKDIAAVYAALPAEQLAPVIATTLAVSLLNLAAIAAGVFLIKWLISKAKK